MMKTTVTAGRITRPLAALAGWVALFLTSALLQGTHNRSTPMGELKFLGHSPSGTANAKGIGDLSRSPTSLPPKEERSDAAAWSDTDRDGIPDEAELKTFADRESFRRWFTAIAEMQFYRLNEQWNSEQRDCAGLVRFAWREALRQHDRAWFRKMGPEYETAAPDVAEFQLDHNPLGEKLFRTDFGSLKQTDLADGKFAEFADARTLKSFNCEFISRDRRQAQPGDLLFYYQPWVKKFPYHVMVFLGQARISPDSGNDWVVYHTGSSPIDNGLVKKVELSVLDHHPDPRWRPIESNRNFLGFYRLKILV